MNKRIAVAFLLLFGAMFTLEGTQSGPSPRASAQEKPALAARPPALLDCSFISPLDSYIQDRFTQMGRGFGLVRVITPSTRLHAQLSTVYVLSESKPIGVLLYAYAKSAKSNNIKKP